MRKAPTELYSRALDVGLHAPTMEWLLDEARHVCGLIMEGGSTYADDRDGGRKVLRECRRFLASHAHDNLSDYQQSAPGRGSR
jgi:hypothetical protein